ncbi:hypothetical protein [Vibrio phage vB_VpaS_CHI]|nr:hypothetical protein [Vibrio phage vB_VpaS_ALK]USL90140.1 hypothetical protein [Vibrio phage vB_VpaS_CHI]
MKKVLLSGVALAVAHSYRPLRAGNDDVSLMISYPTLDEIPENFRPLYTEQDGEFKLSKVVGLKTQTDINNLQGALTKERNDHKSVRDNLNTLLNGRSLEEVQADLDRIPTLEASASGKDLEQQLAGRLQQETAPLNREINKLKQELENANTQLGEYKQRETGRTITDAITTAGTKSKMLQEAMDDVAFMGRSIFELNENGDVVAKTGIPGVTPGISPEVWLTELKRNKPFYWPATQGAGGRGGKGGEGGNNPFSAENWNLTEQGKMIQQDRSLAEQMASQAGTSIGGPRPKAK